MKAVWSRKAVLPAAKKMHRSRVSRESESSLKVLRRPIHPAISVQSARQDPEIQGIIKWLSAGPKGNCFPVDVLNERN